MSKKIEYNIENFQDETVEISKTFTQSDLVMEAQSDKKSGQIYEQGRFDNWKFCLASRINILQLFQIVASAAALIAESPTMKQLIPVNFFPYVIATSAFLTMLERILTKNHKNLI